MEQVNKPGPSDAGNAEMSDDRRSSYRMSFSSYVASALDGIPEALEHYPGEHERHRAMRAVEDGLHSPAVERRAPAAVNTTRVALPAGSKSLLADRSSWYTVPESVASTSESQLPDILAILKPPRSLVSTLSRISLTPSEIPYPAGLLRSNSMQDLSKAERMLGLTKPPHSPCVHEDRPPSEVYTVVGWPADFLPEEESQNGRTAWLHSVTGALIVFNCWGMANAFGLFQAYFETYYLPHGTSPSNISWIGSTQLALVFGLSPIVGHFVDRGYFRLVFHSGSILMLVGIFCTAWCTSLRSLWLVMGLVTGIGMGMAFTAGVLALISWFNGQKLGSAMGLSAAGSCVGGIVYILIGRSLLPSHGFATTMRILGGVAAIALIPPNLVFRMRGQTHKSNRLKGQVSFVAEVRSFITPAYLLAAAGMFFTFLGLYFGFVYIVLFGSTQLKLSNTGATNLLIYMLAANLPGRLLPGLISDKCIGPLNTVIPATILSAGCLGLWMSLGETSNARGALTVVACFYGFVSAGIQVLYAPTVAALCLPTATVATSDSASLRKEVAQQAKDRMGLKSGGIFMMIGLACLIGTPIGGALIKYRTDRGMRHPYLGAQIFACCSLAFGGCLLLATRVARVGWAARRA